MIRLLVDLGELERFRADTVAGFNERLLRNPARFV